MAWDGAPDGWRAPAEQKAADEAAERFERERAAADTRTRTIADAIAFGFDRVALAIVAAAGDDAEQRWHDMNRRVELDDFAPQPTSTVVAMQRIQAEHAAAVRAADERDGDLDDLLDADDGGDGQHPDG